jgi:Flp pilus assembly protein TadD
MTTAPTETAVEPADAATAARHPLAWDRRTWLLALAVLAAAFLVFHRALGFGFVAWDDDPNIVENPFYRRVTAAGLWQFWTTWGAPFQEQYMPVTWTAWGICAWLGRIAQPVPTRPGGPLAAFSPFPFHLLALGAHAVNTVVVFALVRRLIRRVREGAAALGALLFAVHPLQAEAAAWINGGNITIAYLFGLSALLLYLRWAQGEGRGNALLATVLYTLALLAKPTAVCLPLCAVVLEGLALRRPARTWAPLVGLWLTLGAGSTLLQWGNSGASQAVRVPLPLRPFVAGDALAFYLGKLVFPRDMTPEYSRRPEVIAANWWGYVTWLIPVAVGGAVWRGRDRLVQTGAALSLIALLPVLGLVPFYFQHQSTVADRYVYPAMAGVALVTAVLFDRLRLRFRPAPLVAATTLALFGITAAAEAEHWRDSFTLFAHAVDVNPESPTMNYNLGKVNQVAGRLDIAEAHYRAALRIRPAYAEAHTNLGSLLTDTGRADEGAAEYREALRYDPEQPSANAHLGVYLAERGDTVGAIRHWRVTLKRWPTSPVTNFNLGVALHSLGKDDEAATHLRTALAADPSLEPAKALLARIKRGGAGSAPASKP